MRKEKLEAVKAALRRAYLEAGVGNGKVVVQRRKAITAIAKALGISF